MTSDIYYSLKSILHREDISKVHTLVSLGFPTDAAAFLLFYFVKLSAFSLEAGAQLLNGIFVAEGFELNLI